MSPQAIENRLKLVNQLFELCLFLRRGYLEAFPEAPRNSNEKLFEELKSKIQDPKSKIQN